ncbi:hypothetical protein PHLGIDRAFT_185601 [Phlebiopsis gigantea 11061_1 CR5-6]|uniref:Uncharacterized protein n=1 Tax=Phlebiopsis gigantea (strain 11061_1 CR5-6) TaxID=745531 RepID=A0A0C3S4X1_PHLG1|nr:hypothetical protein PHLGIDRAFT_185601 [Phlebiopsis gigantea 11061_1 CR5-6]
MRLLVPLIVIMFGILVVAMALGGTVPRPLELLLHACEYIFRESSVTSSCQVAGSGGCLSYDSASRSTAYGIGGIHSLAVAMLYVVRLRRLARDVGSAGDSR